MQQQHSTHLQKHGKNKLTAMQRALRWTEGHGGGDAALLQQRMAAARTASCFCHTFLCLRHMHPAQGVAAIWRAGIGTGELGGEGESDPQLGCQESFAAVVSGGCYVTTSALLAQYGWVNSQ